MNAQVADSPSTATNSNVASVLVRFGRIPEVGRAPFLAADDIERGSRVIVRTHRGLEIGELLEDAAGVADDNSHTKDATGVLRVATAEDLSQQRDLDSRCEAAFEEWANRIVDWELDLELIDLEWMLDGKKLVLYVLNERGPESTKLALHAAAAGLGIVEVQPVNAEGLVQLPASGGGCGTGGCGSGGCH